MSASVIYNLIDECMATYPSCHNVSQMCQLGGVSRSGYYAWRAAASKRQEPKKPEPVLNLNLDEEDYAPAPQQKPEKKSATSTHKKAPPASHAAENLKNFFQNH